MTHRWRNLLLVLGMVLLLPTYSYLGDYYTHSGFPATGSVASSASMRAELDLIAAGFDKLPTFAGNGSKAVIVNSGATALGTTTGTLALAGNLATTGAFNTTLIQGATTSLTLPLVNGTLASLAGTETLTNKTITSAVFGGTYTLAGTPTYGTGTMTGGFAGDFTLSSSHACATNYTRIGPNFCGATILADTAYVPANSCTGHVIEANTPANKLALFQVKWRTKANNAAGARLGSTTFSGASATCAFNMATSTFSTYEQAAVAAATVIAQGSDMFLATTAAGGILYATDLNNGGNGTSEIVSIRIFGYYD